MEHRGIPQNRNILSDQLIVFTGYQAQKHCPQTFRKVVVWDQENEREIVLLTNHMKFEASTISAIYKERWPIELFFKALKQNLKVKTFVGTSQNALYIQIWTALLAMLLIKYLRSNQSLDGRYRIWSLSPLEPVYLS
ncbi:MAG TPA: transposase [Nitrospiria bacterium]|jgi:IS4 transposase